MGASQNLVTIVGLILIVALLLLLFCRYLGGWTRTRTWFLSSREEKMVLTRGGLTGLFNPNGCVVPSDSEVNISTGGSFRRFDKDDTDFQLIHEENSNIPPQPLRPAPIPPGPSPDISSGCPFSVDNQPPPPKIPPPPAVSMRGGALSSTNPFLPLLQASTQFFSQTISNFQQQGPESSVNSNLPPSVPLFSSPSMEPPPSNSTNQRPRISMGELLFSSTSPEPETAIGVTAPSSSAEPLFHLPVTGRVFPEIQPMEVNLLQMTSLPIEIRTEKSLVETMREEIRLENEKMRDATKTLLAERNNDDETEMSGTGNSSSRPSHPIQRHIQLSGERKFSAPDIPFGDSALKSIFEKRDDTIGGASPSQMTSLSGPAYRNRSFSLRQASVESIGDSFDLTSPEQLPFLQRALSCDSVCSDTSVVLGDFDTPHVTGYLCIGLEYDSETADLIVNVMEGKELVGLDPDPTIPFDSYVRVYLLPDKTTNMQTRIYRKSLSPVYKEKFMFGLDVGELPTRSLVFYLYATNKFSNTLIGEVELKLTEFDIGKPIISWLPLTDTGQRGGELGEIMFSLSYLPTAERLTVVVVKARNLKFPHQRETGDPFVKVYLLQKGKKVSKKKSSTKKGERNPIFNEAMIFSVPTHALQTIQLRITVSDSSEMEGRAYSIGHVIVGSSATGKPLSHWNQMLSSLRKPIGMFHSLRK